MQQPKLEFQENVPLSTYTTIGLGGQAKLLKLCQSVDEVRDCLTFAKDKKMSVQILGGGSNILFPDEGYDGFVIKIDLKGISLTEDGDWIVAHAAAGEDWDEFVRLCIEHDCSGIECLSGIPGLIGATPMQNVGAYGQEVSDTIVSLKTLDSKSLKQAEFTNKECRFGYRQSRFRIEDAGRYIITEVTFRLRRYGRPEIRYPELRNYIEAHFGLNILSSGRAALDAVRSAVLAIRKKKSMVIDPTDPNTMSVGSFFMNPILPQSEFAKLEEQWKLSGGKDPIPTFNAQGSIKVPAAWLVEKAGFHRGYRKGGAGISANHSLALINCGGTTREILDLAEEIQEKVFKSFAIRLEREPVVVSATVG
jgi:UDP-N-acetylmuramate dehydrogenase